MKININGLDFDEFEDESLPDREKFKFKPKVKKKKESNSDRTDTYIDPTKEQK